MNIENSLDFKEETDYLDDPGLLAELQGLLIDIEEVVAARKVPENIESRATELRDVEGLEVFTDDDLHDSELLAALAELQMAESPVEASALIDQVPNDALHNALPTEDVVFMQIQQIAYPADNNSDINDAGELALYKNTPKSTSIGEAQDDLRKPDLILVLNQRYGEYTAMALKFKNDNNIQKAREMLMISKRLKNCIDMVNSGLFLPPDFQLPPPPSTSQTSTIPQPAASCKLKKRGLSIQKPSIDNTLQNKSVEWITQQLDNQIAVCEKLAALHYSESRHTHALLLHKLKKQFIIDKETVITTSTIPPLRKIIFTHDRDEEKGGLSLNELELRISCNMDGPVSVQVIWIDGQIFTSPMLPVIDCWKCRIAIQRGKQFVRMVERKRVSLIISAPRKSWFGGVDQIGKCALKIDALLGSSDFSNVCEVYAMSGRKVVGSFDVWIGISEPLVKTSTSVVTQEWIIVGESEVGAVTVLLASATISPFICIKSALDATPVQSVDTLDLELAFNNPERISSNHVLEVEYNAIAAEIENLKAGDAVIPEDVEEASQAYQLRLNTLVSLVQTGSLSIESYLTQVKQSLADTKKMALVFKRAGNIEYARKSLVRCKLIETEIQEMMQ